MAAEDTPNAVNDARPAAPAVAVGAGGRAVGRGRALAAALALALALGATLVACGNGATDDTPATASSASAATADPARAVRAAPTTVGPLVATRSASVTLRPAQESRVASGATGRVAAILAREGATVAEGDPLVRLDDAQARVAVDGAELALAQARIQLERARRSSTDAVTQAAAAATTAEQNLALVRRQLAEAESLLELGAVAPTDVDALRAQASQAQSAVLQAREAVERADRADTEDLALLELQVQQAEVQSRQARDALAETIVRAPFAGDVAELFVEVGEFVGAGSPVARLLGSGPKVASFTVPPEDAPLLENAGVVTIAYAGLELPATITRLERQAQQARLVTVLALIDADAPRTPPGALAEVRYEVTLGEGLRVPSGALLADAGRTYVFQVVDETAGSVARRTEVRVVAESGNVAVVVGVPEAALTPGALVISPRPLDVRDGAPVRVVGE
ncbi:MAG: HlyD family efflux transporter periplasmic adaptor subunit [Trueperaceae bacterium]|nr:HlyD family efflux transporter periplasmic adaptor subunit [Trueperaceae bacterium]